MKEKLSLRQKYQRINQDLDQRYGALSNDVRFYGSLGWDQRNRDRDGLSELDSDQWRIAFDQEE